MKVTDMTGTRFGLCKVLSRQGSKNNRAMWLCECECGNQFVRAGIDIRKAAPTSSCGCNLSSVRSDNGKQTKTHGLSRGEHRKLYDVYRQILRRCYNETCKDYPRYGSRGIKCLFPDVKTFIDWALSSGYKVGLTIERIDVNGHYSPVNCTWIENEKQALNRERSIKFSFKGKTQDIRSWANEYGIKYNTLRGRLLSYGWPIDKALLTPVGGNND